MSIPQQASSRPVSSVVLLKMRAGWLHLMRRNFRDAAGMFEQALSYDPQFLPAQVALGWACFALGEYEAAEMAAEAALGISPDSASAQMLRARVSMEFGRFATAIQACRAALDLQPGLVPGRFLLAQALAAANLHAEAIEAYRHALNADPFAAPGHLQLAGLHLMEGSDRHARAACIAGLRSDAGVVTARIALGDLLFQREDFHAALTEYQAALEVSLETDHMRWQAHFRIANALVALGRHEQAIEHYREARRHEVEAAECHHRLGRIYTQLGRPDDAEVELAAARKLDPHRDRIQKSLTSEDPAA